MSEWQWHQLGHMPVCTMLQTDNHASTPPLSFLQAGCPSFRPTNSVKALKSCNTYGEITSRNLRPRYDRHFVGMTWHNVWSWGAKSYRVIQITSNPSCHKNVFMITILSTKRISVRNIYESFTHKMAAKRQLALKLRHCHTMYRLYATRLTPVPKTIITVGGNDCGLPRNCIRQGKIKKIEIKITDWHWTVLYVSESSCDGPMAWN